PYPSPPRPFPTRRSSDLRQRQGRRVRWLDLHNVLGIITLAWFGIVTLTGVINSLAAPIELMWQSGQLAEMAAQSRDAAAPTDRRSEEHTSELQSRSDLVC